MSFFKRHQTDHVAAALIRRHFFQQLPSPVKHPHARRTEQLMTGKGVKIAAEILDVDS